MSRCWICIPGNHPMRPGTLLPICDEHLATMVLEAVIGPRGQYIPIPRPEVVW